MTDDSRQCGYRNSVDDTGCQFESLGSSRYLLSVNGRDYCWWHATMTAADMNARGGVSWQTYRQILLKYIAIQINSNAVINLSGVRLESSPFGQTTLDKPANVVIGDTVVNQNVEIPSQWPIDSLVVHSLALRGNLELQGIVTSRIEVNNSQIRGSLGLYKAGKADLLMENSRVHGAVKLVRLGNGFIQDSIVGSIEVGAAEIVEVRRSRVRKGISSGEAHTVSLELCNRTKIRHGVRLNSRQGGSTFFATDSEVTDDAQISGQWKSLYYENSKLSNLKIDDARINSLTAIATRVKGAIRCADTSKIGTAKFSTNCDVTFLRVRDLESLDIRDSSIRDVSLDDCPITKHVIVADSSIVRLNMETRKGERAVEIPAVRIANSDVEHASFNGRTFLQSASFESARFGTAPRFLGCKFEQQVSFPRDLDSYGLVTPDDTANFIYLRQQMENARNREFEGVFFALEQRARLTRTNWYSWDALFSRIYAATSNYGNSIGRAIASLVCTMAFFALAYGFGISHSVYPNADIAAVTNHAINMSISQTFTPFFMLRESGWSWGWRIAWIIQSLISVAIIAELLVTIRWRFRRG